MTSAVVSHDVVVLGSGVSGLLIAGELARSHDVLVIEQAERIPRTKYWLTDNGSAAANEWLTSAVDTHYAEMAFTASDGTSYIANGDYVLWHTDKLIDLLISTVQSRSGTIALGHRFVNLAMSHDGPIVVANDKRIRCKLIIDCMGHGSPIIYAKRAIDILGYYLLYGATFPCAEMLTPVALHNLMLSARPGYIEAFPTSDGFLHIVLIVPLRGISDKSDIRSDFQFIVTKSSYARHISDSQNRSFLGGVVPVGRMRRHALDNVFFFGEAGQVNPAASATALTRMLYSYEAVAARLSACLRDGRLSARDLSAAAEPTANRLNERLQRALFRSILTWTSDDYRKVIEELITIDDPEFVNGLIFGNIDERWAALARRAGELVRTRSTKLLAALVRGLLVS
ncbi:MAG TPA: lycopene cyclase family protein [Thermoanaerobaculia bacterium]|nr:lycopene cyclase family protein [Thermoanaerobaculia bacterium]